jgi:glyoxylase-like metal-dependent hydrolase (beta-lactamase superfamily II)
MVASVNKLPAAAKNQAYVEVSALNGGWVTLPEMLFVTDVDPKLTKLVPSMCFLISHPAQPGHAPKRIVFDLGIKRDMSQYAQGMQDHLSKRQPIINLPDTAESLRAGGLDPAKDIDYVILSHTHWDHIGLPSDYPQSQFVVGSGTLHTVVHGAPHYPPSMFEEDPLPLDRTLELVPTPSSGSKSIAAAPTQQTQHRWTSVSTLPHVIDFFGDGSVYIVDAPGHLQGHVNLLARVSPSKWVYLGGDCCHDARIIRGEKETATYDDGHGGTRSVHSNLPLAKDTIAMIQQFIKVNGEDTVEWIIAHDKEWADKNPAKFFPGHI